MEDIGWEDKRKFQAGKILHWHRENSDRKNDEIVLFAQNKVGIVEAVVLSRTAINVPSMILASKNHL